MVYQTVNGTNSILYAGFIRDITDPRVLEKMRSQLQNGDVVGEYLNRVIGGTHCEPISESEIADEWAKQDPSRTLKATYSRQDLEKRIAELQNPRDRNLG